MRKVIVDCSIYIPTERLYYWKYTGENYRNYTVTGVFHQFMQEIDEGSMFVVAVVELEDGKVITPPVGAITFID